MPETPTLVLIVDGNNLAHHLYHFSTHHPVSSDDIRLLAMQLSMYVRGARRPVVVELCLDHYHPDHPLPVIGGVKVLVAELHEEADDLVRQRFRFHYHQGHPCLVITNDTEVCEDVQDEGGESLLAYDFVRRQGKKPVFRDPLEFKPLVKKGPRVFPAAQEPSRVEAAWQALDTSPQPSAAQFAPPVSSPPVASPPDSAPQKPPLSVKHPSSPPAAPEAPRLAAAAVPPPPQPAYRLTLETWPLEAGVRFLVDSFCQEHGAEYRSLYRSLKDHPLVPADLADLAAALSATCGKEPGFAARGSLIDRVRLALLLSPEEDVPLSVVAERTGLNPNGLHGRIREKARGWLKVV